MGVKAEVEKTRTSFPSEDEVIETSGKGVEEESEGKKGSNEWVELTVEIPGFRDDDAMPIFLAAMLSEALLADANFTSRLWINRRYHWKLYLDVRTPSSTIKNYKDKYTNSRIGLTAVPATVISLTPPISHFAPRASIHTAAEIEVRGRRGPSIR